MKKLLISTLLLMLGNVLYTSDFSVKNGKINEWPITVQQLTLRQDPTFQFTQVSLYNNACAAGVAAGTFMSLMNRFVLPSKCSLVRQSLIGRKLMFWAPLVAVYNYFAADGVYEDIAKPVIDLFKTREIV